AAGVHRALRVGADDLDRAVGDVLQVPAGAGDGAAGADAGDEGGDPAVGLLPQLRAGGVVVGGRVLRVGVLVRLPGARDLADQAVGDVVVGVRMLRSHRVGADDDLGAVGAQDRSEEHTSELQSPYDLVCR